MTGSHVWMDRRPLVLLCSLLLACTSMVLAFPSSALAKEYDVAGTVDCGVRSGHHCSIGDTLDVWTDDLGGAVSLPPST